MKRTTPETIQAQAESQNKRARAKGAKGRGVTALQWGRILRAAEGRCKYCKRNDQPLTMDHVKPLALGGRHEEENIAAACLSCNSSKKDRDFTEWHAWKFGAPAAPMTRPSRKLWIAEHEAAHVAVGAAVGLTLKEAVIGESKDERGDLISGYAWFPRGPKEALALMYAAGVAWEQKRNPGRRVSEIDAKLLRACVATPAGARACVRAASLMLESLGSIHAHVTRALMDRDLTGADILAIARGERLEETQ